MRFVIYDTQLFRLLVICYGIVYVTLIVDQYNSQAVIGDGLSLGR